MEPAYGTIFDGMPYDPAIHHRRSIRLPGYDYASPGAYFVTLVAHARQPIFGYLDQNRLIANPAGLLVEKTWSALPSHYSHLRLDAFYLMPDHLHGILQILETSDPDKPLSKILRAFKTFTARRINVHRETPGQPVWQRNYFERIIRNEREMAALREYVLNNPFGLESDLE